MIYRWFFFILFGFLFGSILFSKSVPKLLLSKDVTNESSDKNPGAANVFIHCGIKCGIFCLFLDMLKGFLPVFIAKYYLNIENPLFSLVIFAPSLGHGLGLFYKFRGGKCIATFFGTMIALLPYSYIGFLLAFLYILFSTGIKISPNSRRSIITFSLYIIISLSILIPLKKYSVAIGTSLCSVLAIIKHLIAPNKRKEQKNCENYSKNRTNPKRENSIQKL